jgi:large subunit ribosomal protein L24
VPVAKVMLVCPTCGRPTRIGMTTKEVKGREVHVRVCKRADCGQEIDK